MMAREIATLKTVMLVALGGFAGSNLRWLVAGTVPGLMGTLIVNAVGSFGLGFVLAAAAESGGLSRPARAVVATGFLSSFTTYSTFALESAQAATPLLAGNVLANYVLGFGGVVVGQHLARAGRRRWTTGGGKL